MITENGSTLSDATLAALPYVDTPALTFVKQACLTPCGTQLPGCQGLGAGA